MFERGGSRGGPPKRGGGRGSRRGGNEHGRGGYRGGNGSRDRVNSPDGSVQNEVPYRFNHYRQNQQPRSRSPTPPRRHHNEYMRSSFDVRNNRTRNDDREHNFDDSRPQSPEDRAPRNDDRQRQSTSSEHPKIPLPLTNKEQAREWKLRLADAEEAVRRAEFGLRRAQIDLESIRDAYEEYTKTTVPQELLKPAW